VNSIEDLQRNRESILMITSRHGAYDVRVFGSIARGEERPDSDVDLLVKRAEATSSWFPAGLVIDLEALLGHRVEVVTEKGLSPYLRETVMREAVPL
jgi:predicted nucleotidyltransferase